MGFKKRPPKQKQRNGYEELREKQKAAAAKIAEKIRPALRGDRDWELVIAEGAHKTDEEFDRFYLGITRITKKAVRAMYPGQACGVRRDRGTASSWIVVKLSLPEQEFLKGEEGDPYLFNNGERDIRQEMKDALIALGIRYSTYRSDQPPDYEEYPCLSIDLNRVK